VVDTGSKRLVYVERAPGMFDGVEVALGPRCGEYYPVAHGVEVGQRVATTGSFLIDAETRLNPSVAVGYFGASTGVAEGSTGREGVPARAAGPPGEPARAQASSPPAPAKLSATDQALALKQKTCPVTGASLGSMGTPYRVVVAGRTVFLCCKGCEPELRGNTKKYLAKLR
jgi:hypothetical protein